MQQRLANRPAICAPRRPASRQLPYTPPTRPPTAVAPGAVDRGGAPGRPSDRRIGRHCANDNDRPRRPPTRMPSTRQAVRSQPPPGVTPDQEVAQRPRPEAAARRAAMPRTPAAATSSGHRHGSFLSASVTSAAAAHKPTTCQPIKAIESVASRPNTGAPPPHRHIGKRLHHGRLWSPSHTSGRCGRSNHMAVTLEGRGLAETSALIASAHLQGPDHRARSRHWAAVCFAFLWPCLYTTNGPVHLIILGLGRLWCPLRAEPMKLRALSRFMSSDT